MNLSSAKKLASWACAGLAALVLFPSHARAQMGGNNPNMMGASNSMSDRLYVGTADTAADREQGGAYENFLKQKDPAKKIQLGNSFLAKYPKGPLTERVDFGMMEVYRAQQDWKNSYAFADRALVLAPDDVDVLTTIGWTIPHVYSPDDADAEQELTKAETYAKHALEVLAAMPKPEGMSDAQFEAAKAKRVFQAHSALGLVYFRRDEYDKSASELALATKGNPVQDATDLFVLGVDLQNVNRFTDAAAAFDGCAQLAGPLQSQCRDSEASSRAAANASKSK